MEFPDKALLRELAVNFMILFYFITCSIHIDSIRPHRCPVSPPVSHSVTFLPPPESPGSEESPAESPHHVVVNGNDSGTGTGIDVILSPEGRQLSPLTSPLLTDAGCVRNDEDEEARRKVGVKTLGGGGFIVSF